MALNIYVLSAYYIHPLYNQSDELRLSVEQYENVHEFFLENLNSTGITDLHYFKERLGVFRTLKEKNIFDPIIYWSMAKVKHPTLADLAIKLLQIPASSVQIERVFSNWSYVHSALRNRLTFDRSKKLLFVYYNLKIKDENVTDEY